MTHDRKVTVHKNFVRIFFLEHPVDIVISRSCQERGGLTTARLSKTNWVRKLSSKPKPFP